MFIRNRVSTTELKNSRLKLTVTLHTDLNIGPQCEHVSNAGWTPEVDSLHVHADLFCPKKFLVINIILGSKHIFVFCYFVIPVIGLKSFKSAVVLFAPCIRKKWFYQY